jgi:NTE family protein
MSSIDAQTVNGVLLRMGNSIRDIDIKVKRPRTVIEYENFQSDEQCALALQHPTDLRSLAPSTFDLIARHGYEVTDCTLTTYAGSSKASLPTP